MDYRGYPACVFKYAVENRSLEWVCDFLHKPGTMLNKSHHLIFRGDLIWRFVPSLLRLFLAGCLAKSQLPLIVLQNPFKMKRLVVPIRGARTNSLLYARQRFPLLSNAAIIGISEFHFNENSSSYSHRSIQAIHTNNSHLFH
jgi:hypothetical protein